LRGIYEYILFEGESGMLLRLVEIYHQEGQFEEIDLMLEGSPILQIWHDDLSKGAAITKVLLAAKDIDPVLEILQGFYKNQESLRVVILPVEATIPRPAEPDEEDGEEKNNKAEKKSPDRISIEELYQKMSAVAGVSQKYIVMAALAAFVAAIGLLKNDVAVIIGSMVIAPLLSPNMALSLATTLADSRLAVKAIVTNIVGFCLVLLIGIVMGFFMDADPAFPQIAARSDISHFYIFLALATGIAGAYSISTGAAEALVGVMVAVALLPPLVAAGLLFGGAYWKEGSGALLLFFVNLVSINLSGVLTFVLQGIRPKRLWEAQKAQRAVRISVTVCILLLLLLALLIFLG
jgi:uncharacterized hydrophobic protein (TIGR00341 family)